MDIKNLKFHIANQAENQKNINKVEQYNNIRTHPFPYIHTFWSEFQFEILLSQSS